MDGCREFEPLRDHALKIAAACATIGLLWVLATDFISAALRQGGPWSQALIDSMSTIYLLTTTLVVYGMVWSYLHHLGKIGGRDRKTAGSDDDSTNSSAQTALRRHALGIAVAYTVLGYAWILLPDAVITATGLSDWIDVTGRSRLAMFILLATCVIYLWARAHAARVGQAQRTLAGRLGGLGHIVDLLPQQIFVRDADGRYLLRNEAFLRGRGTGVEQSDDDQPQAVAPSPADGTPLLLEERLLLAAPSGALTTDEVTVDGRGRRRVLQTTRVAITGSGVGSPVILGLSIDVTDSRRTEEALRHEKERAEVTLHSISDAVITTGESGTIDYINPTAEKLTRWPLDEARGRALPDVLNVIDGQTRRTVPDLFLDAVEERLAHRHRDRLVLVDRRGQEHAIEMSASAIREADDTVGGAVIVFRDVTDSRRMARRMSYLASHDPLTGLLNRRELERRLKRAVLDAQHNDTRHVLCYIDLDQFKLVNDAAGHIAGDALLRELATRLGRTLPSHHAFARLGGDEFSLLLENCALEHAIDIAQGLVESVADYRFVWEGRSFAVSASVGLVPITGATPNFVQILSHGDIACYTAKNRGRNRIHVYRPDDRRHPKRLAPSARFTDAFNEKRFSLHGQPIFRLAAGPATPCMIEILLRMVDDRGELVPAGEFLPAAERYGLTHTIDRWVIRTALRRFFRHAAEFSGVDISINVSADSLNNDHLAHFVRSELARGDIPAERICFEIPEKAAANIDRAISFADMIKNLGARLALDGTGSALSSLDLLRQLPCDYLKIDANVVGALASDRIDQAIVEAVNHVGHLMGVELIAEGVDDASVVERLRGIGFDMAQGAYLGAVEPLEEVAARLDAQRPS